MIDIVALRHELHQYPELSNKEFATVERIERFMQKWEPDEVIALSNTGRAYVFNGPNPGKTLMFRADLDALPIVEQSDLEYRSKHVGVAHCCGHDGHMAILAGLGQKIAGNRPEKGRVVLLFQPAEEVEQGARDVVNDPNFKRIEPDYIFGLHNVPGVDKHRILVKTGSFAAASKGMTVKLVGKTSHAAEPEMGISPANAIAEIIRGLNEMINRVEDFTSLTLLTIIHIQLGEIAFGTSPGYAEIRITLRAFENEDMALLTQRAEQIITDAAESEQLKWEISYSEEFPATVNHPECVELIRQSAVEHQFQITEMEQPFKWSEDFGYYTNRYKGGFFGLGSGVDQPALHHADFDFPDDIIETGVETFYGIYKRVNL